MGKVKEVMKDTGKVKKDMEGSLKVKEEMTDRGKKVETRGKETSLTSLMPYREHHYRMRLSIKESVWWLM